MTEPQTWKNRLDDALEWNENRVPYEVRDPDEILAILKEMEGFGRRLDEAKQAVKEAVDSCEGDSNLTVVVGLKEFRNLCEKVQNL